MTILSAWLFVVLFAVLTASASADHIGRAKHSSQTGEATVVYGAMYLIVAVEVKNPTTAWRDDSPGGHHASGARPGFPEVYRKW